MSKHRLAAFSLVGAVAILAGCAAPSVKYVNVKADMTEEVSDIFALNTARVTVAVTAPKTEGDKKEGDQKQSGAPTVSFDVSAVADTDKRIGVIPTNNVWSSTKVNIAKVDNTERISNIGIDTTDNGKTLVATVGGLIVQGFTLIALTNNNTQQEEKPCLFSPGQAAVTFNLSGSAAKEASKETKQRIGNACIEVKYLSTPTDAVPVGSLPVGTKSEYYYYSACREVDVKVTPTIGKSITKRLRIPDSNWLQKVAFPYKGSIAMHSVCGVSVTTTGQANPMAPYELATEVLKQAEAIRKAGDGK